MSDNLPAKPPSLVDAFAPERERLTTALSTKQSAAQTVSAARAALDRAGQNFSKTIDDPQLQKAGLWLLEMVKSGAGVLDRATQAEITYVETGARKPLISAVRPTIFYGAAGALALAGFVQGSGLVQLTAAVLAAIHTLDPRRLSFLKKHLPFLPKPTAIEDHSGRRFEAEAHLVTDASGFVAQLTDALKTADHILLRLAVTEEDHSWGQDTRLTGLLQNLLEAGTAGDERFAMDIIHKELPSMLAGEGVELVPYSKKTKSMFDTLPAMGDGPAIEMAAPAMLDKTGRILCRGRVWVRQ